MALLFNRAKMTTATTGTGAATALGSAVDSFQTFAAAGVTDGVTVPYGLEQGDTDWEVGTGVYTAAGTVFTRTPTESSNAGGRVNLDGTAVVFSTMTKAAYDDLAALASPDFTGTPTAPTASVATNTTQLATTAFVLANGGATDIDGLSDGKTTGTANVSLGSGAGGDFGSFGACTLVGNGAGRYLTGGSFNVAAGYLALGATSGVTSANNNVALGPWALGSAKGDYNVGIGRSAGVGNPSTNTGGYNVSIGSLTGGALTTGGYNTIVGHALGPDITTGERNTIIGSWSGFYVPTITTGANNILIGCRVVPSASTVSNEITLGDSSIATLRCQQTTITALSDERDKANITDISLGLEYLEKVRPVEFDWAMREGSDWNGKHVAGFIAQEMMAVEDEYDAAFLGSVLRSNPDKLEVGPAALLPIMVKAIQELSARVKELEAAR
jgi:hypothetical protein